LSLDIWRPVQQLEGEARFVGLFEQPRAQFSMYFERGADDGLRQGVQFFFLQLQGSVQETCQNSACSAALR
jgi:hypothetical protein